MSIKISDLNSAGGDLFAGTDSFMTELQTTETTNIFGGFNQRCGGRRNWSKKRCMTTEPILEKAPKCKPVPCIVIVRRCRV